MSPFPRRWLGVPGVTPPPPDDGGGSPNPPPVDDSPIPFPITGSDAYPYRGFWHGSGNLDFGMTPTDFVNYLAGHGVNAAPAYVGNVIPSRINNAAQQQRLAAMHSAGFYPTTSVQFRRMAMWYETGTQEGVLVKDVPMRFEGGRLVPDGNPYGINLPALNVWSMVGSGNPWSSDGGGAMKVSGGSGPTQSLALTVNGLTPGPYLITFDAEVTGNITAQVYVMVNNEGGLTLSEKGFGTGAQELPFIVPPGSDKIGIRARIQTAGSGTYRLNNVKLVPLHQALRNVIITPDSTITLTRGGVRQSGFALSGYADPVQQGVPILTSAKTVVTSTGISDGPVLMECNVGICVDKPWPVATNWALQRWKEHILEPTAEVFSQASQTPIIAHLNVNEIRGINRDGRALAQNLTNGEYLAWHIDRQIATVRSIWSDIYVLIWGDPFWDGWNGRPEEQFTYGSRREGTSSALEAIKSEGVAFVPWVYGQASNHDLLENYIARFVGAGKNLVAGPGLTVASMDDWYEVTSDAAKAGGFKGVQYMEYHGDYQGVEGMDQYETLQLDTPTGGGSTPFDLTIDDSDHYFEEAFLLGDTCWFLHKFTPAQRAQYLDSRVAQGFNLILGSTLVLDEPDYQGNNNPFINSVDTDWYRNMDDIMQEVEDRGLWYYVPVTWGGYAFSEGIFPSTAAAKTFGAWIASRFNHHKNLIWSPINEWPEGDVSDPSDREPYVEAIAEGILSVIPDALITEHGVGQTFALSSSYPTFGDEDWLAFNGIQTGQTLEYAYKRVASDYAGTPTKPTVTLEGTYESSGKTGDDPLGQRRQLWHSLMSGSAGYGYGNDYVYKHSGAWEDHLEDEATGQMHHALTFLDELSDPLTRVPDQTLFTDTNDENDYTVRKTAMKDSGKLWLAVYLPKGGGVTVKLTTSYLVGDSYTARWFDTETGTFTSAGSGSLPQATKTFTAPTGTDVVLLVDVA